MEPSASRPNALGTLPIPSAGNFRSYEFTGSPDVCRGSFLLKIRLVYLGIYVTEAPVAVE
jgi:hypothetical protein